jgi:hypothetical protein
VWSRGLVGGDVDPSLGRHESSREGRAARGARAQFEGCECLFALRGGWSRSTSTVPLGGSSAHASAEYTAPHPQSTNDKASPPKAG